MVFKGEHGRNHVHGYQMNLLPGDPLLIALLESDHRDVSGTWKGAFYSVSGSSCHKVKVQLQVVLLPKITAIRID